MKSQENYIKINDINIFYTVQGTGPPVLLLHGGGQTGNISFGKLIPLLTNKFSVYVPDARGHGKTDNPQQFLSYEQMANDYLEMIHKLKMKKPRIIGYSDGGQIILEMIQKEPDIGRFIAYGIYATTGPDYSKQWEKFKPAIDKTADEKWYKEILGDYFETIKQEFSPVYGEDYYKEYYPQAFRMWMDEEGYPGEKLRGKKAKLRIIHGDRDDIPVERAVEIYRMVEGSELSVIPNATHALPTVDPNLFYDYFKNYLDVHSE